MQALQFRKPALEMFELGGIRVDFLHVVSKGVGHVFDSGACGRRFFDDVFFAQPARFHQELRWS